VTAVGGAAGSEETLRDGRVVVMRPLRADDAAGPEALWRRLDAPARRRFTDVAHLPGERAGDVALPRPGHAAGIVATAAAGPTGQVAGVARYERAAGDTARFLVFVDASWRRAGLGTLLLRRLAESARHAGVRRLAGDVPKGDAGILGLLEVGSSDRGLARQSTAITKSKDVITGGDRNPHPRGDGHYAHGI